MSITTEIERLQNAKASIKTAIENKGISVGNGLLDTYAGKINEIETGITPTGNIEITKNGTYDVTDKETATVNIESTGSKYPIIEGEGKHEVRFIDYDGTLLKIQYVNDGENATAPELPEHDRLTFVEWNRDYDNITHDLDVGACYKPTSGNTELFINVTEETGLGITLNIYRIVSSGAITVNWGDGSTITFATGTGAKAAIHTYSSYGEYMISIITTINYGLGGSSNTKEVVQGSNEDRNYGALIRCYCSEKVVDIRSYCFYNTYNLEEFTIIKVTNMYTTIFMNTKQKVIIMPRTTISIGSSIANYCEKLKYFIINNEATTVSTPLIKSTTVKKLIFPETWSKTSYLYLSYYDGIEYVWYAKPTSSYTLGTSVGQYSPNLRYFPIYDNLTGITSAKTFEASSLNKIALPPSVTQIANQVFINCGNLTDVYIYATTPPTLGGTGVFSSTNGLLRIHVKPECLEAYQTATNWSATLVKNKLVGDLEGEFKDGYCE